MSEKPRGRTYTIIVQGDSNGKEGACELGQQKGCGKREGERMQESECDREREKNEEAENANRMQNVRKNRSV